MTQHNLVGLGKIIGRVISMNRVLKMKVKGFRTELVDAGIKALRQKISGLLSTLSFKNESQIVDDDEENSEWLNFVNT